MCGETEDARRIMESFQKEYAFNWNPSRPIVIVPFPSDNTGFY